MYDMITPSPCHLGSAFLGTQHAIQGIGWGLDSLRQECVLGVARVGRTREQRVPAGGVNVAGRIPPVNCFWRKNVRVSPLAGTHQP